MNRLHLLLLATALTACANGADSEGPRVAAPDDAEPDAMAPGRRADTGPGDVWQAEATYTLRIDDDTPPPLTLDMDRAEVEMLLGAVADQIVLLELDSRPLLTNTLNAVKAACGDGWRADAQDPGADCGLTALGRRFVGARGDWSSSPEYAMVRLLTMTPANARVAGTSIEFLALVSDAFDIGGGFAQILSDTLEIDRTEEFLTTDVVVASLQENLLATHPVMAGNDFIPITLRDALTDMRTLGEKLGPKDGHPGVLSLGFETVGPVFGPDFRMQVVADSNLRVLDGVDLSVGKEFVSTIVDTTGPTFGEPLEFDFSDPSRFTVSGLVDNPTVDLRFAIFEHDRFVDACTSDGDTGGNCVFNRPGTPEGGDSVWLLRPWTLEYVVAWAGLAKYGNLESQHCYVSCNIAEVAIGQNGDPPGWAHFGVPLDLGPKDQYVWELINEVAQVGLHDSDFADFGEGEADVQFTVEDVDTGITGAEAAEAVRPWLQRQDDVLADFLLGDFRANNGDVDFYWARDEEGKPTLWFVGREDRANGKPYAWQTPGFFADEALSEKLSTPVGEGTGLRERWRPPLGESVVYVEDDQQVVYRLTLTYEDPLNPDLIVRAARR
ncbi:MAG: hypothetical protein KC583_07045 [Myxococcales bacterium]|nr:hypothetical protein [Myxococcales bacterium]